MRTLRGGVVRRDDLSCPYEACDGDRRCAYNPVVGVLKSMRTLDRGGGGDGGMLRIRPIRHVKWIGTVHITLSLGA